MNVNGNTQVLGIIGNPVRHTKSPAMHNYISDKLNHNNIYVPFEVTGDLGSAVKGAYELGIKGINVTVPYKTDVIKFLSDIDSLAEEIGAVNTLVRTDKGYKGYNTDMLGLERAVLSEGIKLEGSTAVLLGAGGAARAAAFMCVKNNVKKLYILNRTASKADIIADDIKSYINKCRGNDVSGKDTAADEGTAVTEVISGTLDDWKSIAEDNLTVFQCTKIGLNESDGAPIEDKAFYDRVSFGIDLVYREGTLFTKLVREAGGVSFNGLKMLIYQGVIAYELWNELTVPDDIVSGIEAIL